MSNKTFTLSDDLYAYLFENSVREPDILRRLREETARDSMARMQIAPEQGQFMQLLVRLMGARRYLEVGVFTGYSSLAVALALPAEGRIVACDVSDTWTKVARRYWTEAGASLRSTFSATPASVQYRRATLVQVSETSQATIRPSAGSASATAKLL